MYSIIVCNEKHVDTDNDLKKNNVDHLLMPKAVCCHW